jgi:hypothetical protein
MLCTIECAACQLLTDMPVHSASRCTSNRWRDKNNRHAKTCDGFSDYRDIPFSVTASRQAVHQRQLCGQLVLQGFLHLTCSTVLISYHRPCMPAILSSAIPPHNDQAQNPNSTDLEA